MWLTRSNFFKSMTLYFLHIFHQKYHILEFLRDIWKDRQNPPFLTTNFLSFLHIHTLFLHNGRLKRIRRICQIFIIQRLFFYRAHYNVLYKLKSRDDDNIKAPHCYACLFLFSNIKLNIFSSLRHQKIPWVFSSSLSSSRWNDSWSSSE